MRRVIPILLLFIMLCSVVSAEGVVLKLSTDNPDMSQRFEADANFLRSLTAFLRHKNANLAFNIMDSALEKFPSDKQVHNDYAVLAHDLGKEELAKKHFKKALSLDASYERARFNLATLYNYLGRNKEAIAELEVLHSLNPYEPHYVYDLAMNKASIARANPSPSLEEIDEIIELLELTQRLSPDFAHTSQNIEVLQGLREYLESVRTH